MWLCIHNSRKVLRLDLLFRHNMTRDWIPFYFHILSYTLSPSQEELESRPRIAQLLSSLVPVDGVMAPNMKASKKAKRKKKVYTHMGGMLLDVFMDCFKLFIHVVKGNLNGCGLNMYILISF